jgi:hypothetical protein
MQVDETGNPTLATVLDGVAQRGVRDFGGNDDLSRVGWAELRKGMYQFSSGRKREKLGALGSQR